MRLASELIRKSIVTADTGEHLGAAVDLLVSPNGARMIGVVVGGGVLGTERGVLPFAEVQTFGTDVVVVKSPDAIVGRDEWHARGIEAQRFRSVQGKRVFTSAGREVGTIKDLQVDDRTGDVLAFVLGGGLVHRDREMPRVEAAVIGPDAMIVPATAIPDAA